VQRREVHDRLDAGEGRGQFLQFCGDVHDRRGYASAAPTRSAPVVGVTLSSPTSHTIPNFVCLVETPGICQS
jgi:hypothetical protein